MPIFNSKDVARIEGAIRQDPGIQSTIEGLASCAGSTAAYLADLGLPLALLKKLEVWGLAKRGYAPTPKGSNVRWVLVNVRQASSGQIAKN